MKKVRELDVTLTHSIFEELLTAAQPVVIRGLVKDWPLVKAHAKSPQAFIDYLQQFNAEINVNVLLGSPAIKGRFFYNNELNGFNYERKSERFKVVLSAITELSALPTAPAIALQGLELNEQLSEVAKQNTLSFLDNSIVPRLWLGNKVVTTTHYDTMENVACAVAGRRHVVLFPPEQITNLYVGPLLLTPAGTPMSLVDLRQPDLTLYPRFSRALDAAQDVILEPGDGLFIPSFWWHNVESLDEISGLVNFWWKAMDLGELSPYQSMLHSLLTIPNLPVRQRAVWENLFAYYVFRTKGDPTEHFPAQVEDILTTLPDERKKNIMKMLAEQLLTQRNND